MGMVHFIRFSVAFFFLLFSVPNTLFGATFTWTGSADSLWSNASNWSGASGYPNGATDDVSVVNNTIDDKIVLTEDITIQNLTWSNQRNRGLNLNGFDLTVKGPALFGVNSEMTNTKSNGQLIFETFVFVDDAGELNLYNVTQTADILTLDVGAELTIRNAPNRVKMEFNNIVMRDKSRISFRHTRSTSIVDFTVGNFCVVEFPKNKTATISGTVSWSKGGCGAYSTFRSYIPGSRADLKFTGGPATGDYNIFEDIEIITSSGGNTFTANNRTDLGGNVNISGTTLAASSCTFDGNGDNTGNWSDSAEWSCNCVPRSLDDVTIQAGKTVTIDDIFAQCDDFTFSSSTSKVEGVNAVRLEIHGELEMNGLDNFIDFTGTTEFRNNVTATVDLLECASCDTLKFYGPVLFEFPGNTWQLNDVLWLGDKNDARRGDLTVDDGTLDANDFDIWVENDCNVNSAGTFLPGTGELRFFDARTSSISVKGTGILYDLVIDKASNSSTTTTIKTEVLISNSLDLSNIGIIEMEDSDTLVLMDGATTTGASNNSHVNPYLKKIGNDDFTFPIGNGTYYRPIGVSDMAANATVSDELVAVYFKASPFDSGMVWGAWPAGITSVSSLEYWDLDDVSGSPTPKISLSWDAPTPSGTINDMAALTIVHWTGSSFENLGNASTTGTTASGSVHSMNNVTSFSPFVLGTTSPNNVLPIELLEFNAELNNSFVDLSWITLSEINNDFFTVERSVDGRNFETILTQKGAGSSNSENSYLGIDPEPLSGISYYRLLQVDFDGTSSYSPLVMVTNMEEESPILMYPNPAADLLQFKLPENRTSGVLQLSIYSSEGRLMHQQHLEAGERSIDVAKLKPGLYSVQFLEATQLTVHQLVISR